MKCKMCGGDLRLLPNSLIAECEYCGTRQTVPVLDNDRKLAMFIRANQLRLQCEFDKAAGVYEALKAEFPKDAEAYWGLVLCKYGIEYVDDPGTGRKIPTCHRSSFDPVQEDENYQKACELADPEAERLYRQEAGAIEMLRQDILQVSAGERDYDIFICYKETNSQGGRSIDSVLAQTLYEALTERGYRVFFSRISLEEKLGSAYEPSIFAALNSARVMLAVGTSREQYEAVWVKNEWSRFLKHMEQDRMKVLVPCYKDMDADGLPAEFSRFQAQDLGKVGALQDLLRGIDKIFGVRTLLDADAVRPAAAEALLERGRIALKNRQWSEADGFFERVLNQAPHCGRAYVGKFCVEQQITELAALLSSREVQSVESLQRSIHYQNAVRYGEPGVKQEFEKIFRQLREQKLSTFYEQAENMRLRAASPKELEQAASAFDQLKSFRDSEEKARISRLAAETSRKQEQQKQLEKKYGLARESFQKGSYRKAEKQFLAIKDYADSAQMAACCRQQLQQRQKCRRPQQTPATGTKKEGRTVGKKARFGAAAVGVVLLSAALLAKPVLVPMAQYGQAADLLKQGNYTEAMTMFRALGEYRDSEEQALRSQYKQAEMLLEAGERSQAYDLFTELGEYENSVQLAFECRYREAELLLEQGAYEAAEAVFEELDAYEDSAEMQLWCRYHQAEALLEQKRYASAIAAFQNLGDFADSPRQIQAAELQWAEQLTAEKKITEAFSHYDAAGAEGTEALKQFWSQYLPEPQQVDIGAVVLAIREDGTVAVSGDTEEKFVENLHLEQWNQLEQVYIGDTHVYYEQVNGGTMTRATDPCFYGLRTDGTVVSAGNNDQGQGNVEGWTDIVQLVFGFDCVYGLRADGTVLHAGAGENEAAAWDNVVRLYRWEDDNFFGLLGIRADGTLLSAGPDQTPDWDNLVQLEYNNYAHFGLRADGTAVVQMHYDYELGLEQVDTWTGVTEIVSGHGFAAGLRSDGTVAAAGKEEAFLQEVGSWKDIVELKAEHNYLVGLKSDGTVVAFEYNNGPLALDDWHDIVSVVLDWQTIVGLCKDGTVKACGGGYYAEWIDGMKQWTEIAAVFKGGMQTIGLRTDGTMVGTTNNGSNHQLCYDLTTMQDIRLPDTE